MNSPSNFTIQNYKFFISFIVSILNKKKSFKHTDVQNYFSATIAESCLTKSPITAFASPKSMNV